MSDDALPTAQAPVVTRPVRRGRLLATLSRTTFIEYRVIFADTDQMGMLYHGRYLDVVERGRNEYLRASGMTYGEIEAQGFVLPIIDAHCQYKASAVFDDLLIVETTMTEVSRLKVNFSYRIVRQDPTGETVILRATTTHASLDKNHRPQRVPEQFLERLIALEPGGIT